MTENETLEPVSFINVGGSTKEVVDKAAREAADAVTEAIKYEVGDVFVTTSETVNPASRFGGTWELQSFHLFAGWYVYVKKS